MSVRIYRRELKDGRRVTFDIDVYEGGRRTRIAAGTPVQLSRKKDVERLRRDAEVKARDIEDQLRIDASSFFERKKRDHTDFVQYCRGLAASRGNPSAWTGMIMRLAEYTGGSVKISSVNALFGQRFRRFLIEAEGIGNSTRKNNIVTFKTALRLAAKDGYLPFEIAERIDGIKKDDAKRNFCTVEQVQQLDAAPCRYESVKVAFLFACFAGFRISDVRALTYGSIQKIDGRLHVAYQQKKTKKHEWLPLSEQAARYLHQASELHVFEGEDDSENDRESGSKEFDPAVKVFAGLPCESTAQGVLAEWGEVAGLPFRLHFHVSRHTFITLALTAGVPMKVISVLAGHASIATTEIYSHMINPAKIAGVDALPLIGRKTAGDAGNVE
ncbi:MAG: tyrosine-type recombinase/integrase [Chlorobium phaeovibrioides]|nr:tyrosine-type recombinase/integrase [Chlorobium phaeovibrioides]